MISRGTACFVSQRPDLVGRRGSMIPMSICDLCVHCSMHPDSHKVGSQDAGVAGSYEQNVNTG